MRVCMCVYACVYVCSAMPMNCLACLFVNGLYSVIPLSMCIYLFRCMQVGKIYDTFPYNFKIAIASECSSLVQGGLIDQSC